MTSTKLQGNYTLTKTESFPNSQSYQNGTINKLPKEERQKQNTKDQIEISISSKKEENIFCFDQKHFTGEVNITVLLLMKEF